MKPLKRALRVLMCLSTHEKVTVNELYDLFNRRETKHSIQRTLETIQSANIPLKIEKGAHNTHDYSLQRAFNYIPEPLDNDEMLAAFLLAPFVGLFEGTCSRHLRKWIISFQKTVLHLRRHYGGHANYLSGRSPDK